MNNEFIEQQLKEEKIQGAEIPEGYIQKTRTNDKGELEFYSIPMVDDPVECEHFKDNILRDIRERTLNAYDTYRISVISGDIEGELPLPKRITQWRKDVLDMKIEAIVNVPEELTINKLYDIKEVEALKKRLNVWCGIDIEDLIYPESKV